MKTIPKFLIAILTVCAIFFSGVYVGQNRAYHHAGVFFYNYVIQDAKFMQNMLDHSSRENPDWIKNFFKRHVDGGNIVVSEFTKSKAKADELVDSYAQQIRESEDDERYISGADSSTIENGNKTSGGDLSSIKATN